MEYLPKQGGHVTSVCIRDIERLINSVYIYILSKTFVFAMN